MIDSTILVANRAPMNNLNRKDSLSGLYLLRSFDFFGLPPGPAFLNLLTRSMFLNTLFRGIYYVTSHKANESMAKYTTKIITIMKWSKMSKSSSLLSMHCVALFNFFWRCWTDLFFNCTFVLVHLLFPIQTLKFLNVEFRYLLTNSSRDQDWLGECGHYNLFSTWGSLFFMKMCVIA